MVCAAKPRLVKSTAVSINNLVFIKSSLVALIDAKALPSFLCLLYKRKEAEDKPLVISRIQYYLDIVVGLEFPVENIGYQADIGLIGPGKNGKVGEIFP